MQSINLIMWETLGSTPGQGISPEKGILTTPVFLVFHPTSPTKAATAMGLQNLDSTDMKAHYIAQGINIITMNKLLGLPLGV